MGCGASKTGTAMAPAKTRSQSVAQVNSIRTVRSIKRESVPRRKSIKNSLQETRCRSLFIGCDYKGSDDRLFDGTIARNDIRTLMSAVSALDFNITDRRLMFEDATDAMLTPTKTNIETHLNWLVQGVQEGDALVLVFSGRCDEDGALRPTDFRTNGVITHAALYAAVVEPLPKNARLTVIFACPFNQNVAPLCLDTLWVDDTKMQFLEPHNGDDCTWRPSRGQQDINKLGFRKVNGKRPKAQVVVLFSDDIIDAAHPQYVSQFSHPWKQKSMWGPAGSFFANTLAQVVHNNSAAQGGVTAADRGLSFGIGAFHERMKKQLDVRGYDGTPRMAFSTDVDLYAPFTLLPVAEKEFAQPKFTLLNEDGTGNNSSSGPGTPIGVGKCRSLIIGVDYIGTKEQRNNVGRYDAETMVHTIAALGFDTTERCVLVEDEDMNGVYGPPTHKHIMSRLEWLVDGCKAGDSLFFFYSGDMTQDGSCILPCDHEYGSDEEFGPIANSEISSILLHGMRAGVKLTAIYAAHVNNPLRLKAQMHLQAGMNFCPPSGCDPDWRPNQQVQDLNDSAFQDTKRDITHEGEITVLTACKESAVEVSNENYTHCWKYGPVGTAFVNGLAQVVYNNTRNHKPSMIGLGQLYQRIGKNLKMRKHRGIGALYHSLPLPDMYKTYTPRAGGLPGPPLSVCDVQGGKGFMEKIDSSSSLGSGGQPGSVANLKRASQRRFSTKTDGNGTNGATIQATTVQVPGLLGTDGSPLLSTPLGNINAQESDGESSMSGSTTSLDELLTGKKKKGDMPRAGRPSQAKLSGGNPLMVNPTGGKCKSLFIGLDYSNSPNLAPNPGGPCDILTAMELAQQLGFDITERQVLVDNISIPQRTGHPTKTAMLQGLQWLLSDATSQDSLLVVFSGHGTQVHDDDNDEEDGLDEHFVLDKGETVSDDEVFANFLLKLPAGCRCTFIVDAPHSATICDLPWGYKWSPDHSFAQPTSTGNKSSRFLNTLSSKSYGAAGTRKERATVGRNVEGWKRVGSKSISSNVVCITSSADDEEAVQIDIGHIKHPWKYAKKGGALIHSLAEQVHRNALDHQTGELALSFGQLIGAMQKHLIVRGTMLNEINLSAHMPLNMGKNFSLFGLLPSGDVQDAL